jgi:hypothetical protein
LSSVDHNRAALAEHFETAMLLVVAALADQAKDVKTGCVVGGAKVIHPSPSNLVTVSDHPVELKVTPDRGSNLARQWFRRWSHLRGGEEE